MHDSRPATDAPDAGAVRVQRRRSQGSREPSGRSRTDRPVATAGSTGALVGPPTGAQPGDSPILAYLRRLHERFLPLRDGEVATYIPELARVDADAFGIVIATVDGAVYEVGDARARFTIQSMSKPLTYAAILESRGEAAVRRRIGVEPTGDAFNAITLEHAGGTPLNPMVNAGAIAAVGLLEGEGTEDRTARLVETYGAFCGRALRIDTAVYASERDTGHRNRAIAHLLRSTGALDGDPDDVVDTYFRQCSAEVDTRDLALVAATLANGGRHPLTGIQAASDATVRDVLSVMATCGMYDGAGEWLFEVGLPAKSGVSGGILAVLPGRLGIGVWSPRLDRHGNSVRGVAVCRAMAAELELHLVRGQRDAGPIRTRTTVAGLPSKRHRSPAERERLQAEPAASMVLELQGELGFVAAERLAREALAGERPRGAWRGRRVERRGRPRAGARQGGCSARGPEAHAARTAQRPGPRTGVGRGDRPRTLGRPGGSQAPANGRPCPP
jgi:glutaminase